MNRRELIGGLGCVSSLLIFWQPVNAEQDEGKRLPLTYPDFPRLVDFAIKSPGRYVLDTNQIRSKFNGPRRGGFLLSIFCGAVEIDFGGHVLGADFGWAGVALSVKQNLQQERYPKLGYTKASLDSRFVTLRNGTIDLARGEQTLIGIEFSNEWGEWKRNLLAGARPQVQSSERIDGRYQYSDFVNIPYIRNDYLFENLKVLTNSVAMVVEGSHTIIRNCVIESAGNAAIFIAGPNVTIENCEIRLRKFDTWGGDKKYPRAAIVLRDGSNAIIRNNRIRVDYAGDGIEIASHCILVHDRATDVLIEGNTFNLFFNIKTEPVVLTEGVQATVRDNQQERHWLPF